jgi:hypothetical protein
VRLWPRRHGTSYDLLVAGLGNPGREHARNRHNVGWHVVDELARRHGGAWKQKFSGRLAEIRVDGHRVALLKPETYMNDSGRSVRAAMQFFKLEPDAVLVVHDESDLPLARLQARIGGGTAGLDQPDLDVRIFREARGQNRSRGAGTNHQEVEPIVWRGRHAAAGLMGPMRRSADSVFTFPAARL